jgi:hypothetical protein
MHAHPELSTRLVAGRQADRHRTAAEFRRARAVPPRPAEPVRIRERVGWWLIGRGMRLIGP